MSHKFPITLAAHWERLQKEIDKLPQPMQDPCIVHNLKVLYYSGFQDMLNFVSNCDSSMTGDEAVHRMIELRMELCAFFDPIRMKKEMEDAYKKHDEFVVSMLEEVLGGSVTPDKSHLH